jgi:hypothetical protein
MIFVVCFVCIVCLIGVVPVVVQSVLDILMLIDQGTTTSSWGERAFNFHLLIGKDESEALLAFFLYQVLFLSYLVPFLYETGAPLFALPEL